MSSNWNRCRRCGSTLEYGQKELCKKCKDIMARRKRTQTIIRNAREKQKNDSESKYYSN